MDNATAAVYASQHKGTRSLTVERDRILSCAELRVLTLSTLYILGVDNWQADFLVPGGVPGSESWILWCGTPDVYFLASWLNNKLNWFVSRYRDP